jgi:hypothetical protein
LPKEDIHIIKQISLEQVQQETFTKVSPFLYPKAMITHRIGTSLSKSSEL